MRTIIRCFGECVAVRAARVPVLPSPRFSAQCWAHDFLRQVNQFERQVHKGALCPDEDPGPALPGPGRNPRQLRLDRPVSSQLWTRRVRRSAPLVLFAVLSAHFFFSLVLLNSQPEISLVPLQVQALLFTRTLQLKATNNCSGHSLSDLLLLHSFLFNVLHSPKMAFS